jgi:hypothetical protein
VDHGLVAHRGIPTVLQIFVNPINRPAHVSLPLLQDPVGLFAIAMTLATPILCAEQVKGIQEFNPANRQNIAYRAHLLNAAAINGQVSRANAKFRWWGGRWVSAALVLVSLGLSAGIDYLLRRWGLLERWNYTHLHDSYWRREVYQGWWANLSTHTAMGVVFFFLGGYFFYFLIKQLTMGYIFVAYSRRVAKLNFGLSPNMAANMDGYWGLRYLRHLMQTTYGSTLGHFIMVVGILAFWLPFGAFGILMVTLVMIINASVVVYPSIIASTGAVMEKKSYVAHVVASRRPKAVRDTMIDKVWSTPNLPFHLRSTLTAGTVYLLIPLVLALVSTLVGP